MARRSNKTRVASLHSESYGQFVELLVKRRKASKLSQQAVGDALGWNQSIVAKIETCQRRIDVVELLQLASVVGFDAVKLVQELRRAMIAKGEISETK